MNDDEHWMREALREAEKCLRADLHLSGLQLPGTTQAAGIAPSSTGPVSSAPQSALASLPSDVPVGAICVAGGEIISCGHNRRELDHDPTAHAEVLAIRAAAQSLNTWRLDNVTLYVTLEPCVMCAGAIWLARPARIVFGAWDAKAGACGSLFDIPRDPRLNYRPQLRGGVLEEECSALLHTFFAQRRR